jgi:3-isopropylmalate/(R)-2-methylmalate dehydratase small subunit
MHDADSRRRGRCHKFGHEMHMDTKVMPYRYMALYPFDADKLVPHLFEEVMPDFHRRTQPGDFIIAGRNFAYGKAHPQGLIAIAALKLVLLCESMPFNSFRGAISRGILCHRRCAGITDVVSDGDTVEMDFATGEFCNLTTGATATYAPVQRDLLDMMLLGGMRPMLARWRDEHARPGAQEPPR